MKSIKSYFSYLKNNATNEMIGFTELCITTICIAMFAIVAFVAFIYFENILKVGANVVLVLIGLGFSYVVLKAVYDFFKLSFRWFGGE